MISESSYPQGYSQADAIASLVSKDGDGQPVTTSIMIAAGVGNPHKGVIQLIRQNQGDLEEFGEVAFEMAPFKTAGGTQSREVAVLNEDQATLLLTYMRNNDRVKEFKMWLVKAFRSARDLAKQIQDTDPREMAKEYAANLSKLDVLKMAIDSERERLVLAAKVEEDRPKVIFHDQVVESYGSVTVAKAAKILGTGRTRLFEWLRQHGWVQRNNEPYQKMIESGHLDVKLGSWKHPEHGIRESVTTMVTGKGLARLQQLLNDGRLL